MCLMESARFGDVQFNYMTHKWEFITVVCYIHKLIHEYMYLVL